MDILTNFGVKPILLAAQIVNFLILLYLLKRFMYKPLLKVLEKRKEKIAESLKNAEEIEKRLVEISEEKEKKLLVAGRQAQQIIEEAGKGAQEIIREAQQKANLEIEKIAERSRKKLAGEQERMEAEMQAHLADLVVKTLEKVTDKVLTSQDQRALVEKSIKGLS